MIDLPVPPGSPLSPGAPSLPGGPSGPGSPSLPSTPTRIQVHAHTKKFCDDFRICLQTKRQTVFCIDRPTWLEGRNEYEYC